MAPCKNKKKMISPEDPYDPDYPDVRWYRTKIRDIVEAKKLLKIEAQYAKLLIAPEKKTNTKEASTSRSRKGKKKK